MKITIHRGLNQIGGCITEICTETSRVFIDMGQNLPGNGEETTPKQDREMVEGIFRQNKKADEAVFYTHAHEDHVGLFGYVPGDVRQFIGEGGKQMLMDKYELIRKGHERELDVMAALCSFSGSEQYCERCVQLEQTIEGDEDRLRQLGRFLTWSRPKPHTAPEPLLVGDIRVTPFYNCHSIYDSAMFLIEAGGKRIWHTGDYREHGYMGKGLMPTLRHFATDIDVLITEGTMLGRKDECIHEREVSRRMASVMGAFKYIVVLASATDIERLASIRQAAAKAHKTMYVCSGYMNRTMRYFNCHETHVSKGLFSFHYRFLNDDNINIESMKKHGFVLVSGVNNLEKVERVCGYLDLSDVLFIYSAWDGYYKNDEQVKENPRYKHFREAFSNVVDIHTSGHADRKTIRKVIETVNPKHAVVCIHKDKGQSLEALPLTDELKGRIVDSKQIEL